MFQFNITSRLFIRCQSSYEICVLTASLSVLLNADIVFFIWTTFLAIIISFFVCKADHLPQHHRNPIILPVNVLFIYFTNTLYHSLSAKLRTHYSAKSDIFRYFNLLRFPYWHGFLLMLGLWFFIQFKIAYIIKSVAHVYPHSLINKPI